MSNFAFSKPSGPSCTKRNQGKGLAAPDARATYFYTRRMLDALFASLQQTTVSTPDGIDHTVCHPFRAHAWRVDL